MRPFYAKTFMPVIITAGLILFMTSTSCKKNGVDPHPVDPPDSTQNTNPAITSLSATTLHYGDTLLIKGKNFNASAANNVVTINGIQTTIISASSNSIAVVVPAVGNTTADVSLTTGTTNLNGGSITYVPDVFIAGYENNSAYQLAKYWKNGTAVTLSTDQSALTSIFINGNDIYAAGYENASNIQLATYWKNETKVVVGSGASAANAITSDNGDVFLGGWEVVNGFDIPRYWKNGIATSIEVTDPIVSSNILGNGACNAVFLNNNAVYAVGYYRNSQGRFEPWETTNGLVPANTLNNNDKHCFANAVFVTGTDVYIVGNQNNPVTGLAMATIWKNGTPALLTDGNTPVGVATAVFVEGNDVYVAGYEQENYFGGGQTVAKYWKNGVAVKLSNTLSNATGITVFGKDVYVSGWENNGTTNIVKYWKNGIAVNLTDGIFASSGNAIVVR